MAATSASSWLNLPSSILISADTVVISLRSSVNDLSSFLRESKLALTLAIAAVWLFLSALEAVRLSTVFRVSAKFLFRDFKFSFKASTFLLTAASLPETVVLKSLSWDDSVVEKVINFSLNFFENSSSCLEILWASTDPVS